MKFGICHLGKKEADLVAHPMLRGIGDAGRSSLKCYYQPRYLVTSITIVQCWIIFASRTRKNLKFANYVQVIQIVRELLSRCLQGCHAKMRHLRDVYLRVIGY